MSGGAQESVQLSTLIHSLLQKAYHDLSVLAELLPRKTDVDKKIEIVQFARQTRLLLIRLLALVKWVGNSDPVRKCAEVAGQLSHQSWVYVDTADQLVHLARQTLQHAAIPNLTLAPAIDVLSTGFYPRLPTCIRDRIIPPPPLPLAQQKEAFSLLEGVIRHRLVHEVLPQPMKVASISKGRVVLLVPYEFEVTLTVVGDDHSLPWRLLGCEILVGQAFPGSPVLVHNRHKHFLHELAQSRLCSEDGTLADLYSSLHFFCLALQLDWLHAQAELISSTVCGVYVKVDDYSPGHQIKLAYWRASGSSQFLSAFLLNEHKASWPKIVITVDPSSVDRPFTTSHTPPIPGGQWVGLDRSRLSLEELISTCVQIRSSAVLHELLAVLQGTVWKRRAAVQESPVCLKIRFPLSSFSLLLSVDARVGHVVASLDCFQPQGWGPLVARVLLDLERNITANKNCLPEQLGSLQCALFLADLFFMTADHGMEATYSIPVTTPLPLPPHPALFVAVSDNVHLVVTAQWLGSSLQDRYYLLKTKTASLPAMSPHGPALAATPFLTTSALTEVDPHHMVRLFTGALTVHECGIQLKRKLQECSPPLPSSKRLCLSPRLYPHSGLVGLLRTQLSLLHLNHCLQSVGITALAVEQNKHGSCFLNIFRFPSTGGVADALLNSYLLSCQLWPNQTGCCYKMVFRSAISSSSSSSSSSTLILHRQLPSPSSCEVGELLLRDWRSKALLLSLTRELEAYLSSSECSMLKAKCSITSFTFERLSILYCSYQLSVLAQGNGLQVDCSSSSPHLTFSVALQQFLQQTCSLPLLLQGVCLTMDAAAELSSFVERTQDFQLVAVTPSNVQLIYSYVCCAYSHLNLCLLSDQQVSFCGISYERSALTAVIAKTTLQGILQLFMEQHVHGKAPPLIPDPEPMKTSDPKKRILVPSPVPIASPHLSSPLPSIPSLPPPASVNTSSQTHLLPAEPSWEHTITIVQLRSLLHPPSNSPSQLPLLHSLLGSLSLLLHFVHHSSQDKHLHSMLHYVSVDRGAYSYRTDTLSLTLGMDTTVTSLKLSVSANQEGRWSPQELEYITEFFYSEVSSPPYHINCMTSFMRLLGLPPALMRACVQLMHLHLHPPSDAIWRLHLCLTAPKGSDLMEIATPGSSAVIFRGKLLLFFRLVRQADEAVIILPILHDPKNNNTYVARQVPRGEFPPLLQAIEQLLRHPQQESRPHETGLYHRLKSLLYRSLPL